MAGKLEFCIEGKRTETYADSGQKSVTIRRLGKRHWWQRDQEMRLTWHEAQELQLALVRAFGIRVPGGIDALATFERAELILYNAKGGKAWTQSGKLGVGGFNVIPGDSLDINFHLDVK